MRRILVYENRKSSPQYWDASTPETEAGAMLALFRVFDTNQFYSELKCSPELKAGHVKDCSEQKRIHAEQLALYKQAKQNDADAANRLLHTRRHYEYEEFKFEWVDEAKAQYSQKPWGTNSPCAVAYVTTKGLVRWEYHDRVRYELHATQEEAVAYLQTLFRFVEKARGLKCPSTHWNFEKVSPHVNQAKRAKILTKRKRITPGKVVALILPVCPICRTALQRFTPPT
jgi:hypothetical protein